jgi:hypothetical protein
MFKLQTTLDRHSPRQKINDRLLLDPLHFSLPSTFKESPHDTVFVPAAPLVSKQGWGQILIAKMDAETVSFQVKNRLFAPKSRLFSA